jgi:hypothetical protein
MQSTRGCDMSNLEHLVENGLTLLEKGANYYVWMNEMWEDSNWSGVPYMTPDQLWEICQYVHYVWVPTMKE